MFRNTYTYIGFSGGLDGKESACNAGDTGSIPGSGRSPGEENGNPLQYSCLENPMERGVWQATVLGVAKSWTQLSDHTHTHTHTHTGGGHGNPLQCSCLANPMDRRAWWATVHSDAKSQT